MPFVDDLDDDCVSTTSRLFGRTGTVLVEDKSKKVERPRVLVCLDYVVGMSLGGMILSLLVYNSPLKVQWDVGAGAHAGSTGSTDLFPSPFAMFLWSVLAGLLDALMTAVWVLTAASIESQQMNFAMTNLRSVEQTCGEVGRERRRRRVLRRRGRQGWRARAGVPDDISSVYSDFTYMDAEDHFGGDDDDGHSVCSSCRGGGVQRSGRGFHYTHD